MSCTFGTNIGKDCRDGNGGIVQAWLCKHNDIDFDATTFNPDGSIATLTLVASPSSPTPFHSYEFEFASGLAESTETSDRVSATNVWTHTLTFPIAKQDQVTRNEIKVLAAVDVFAVVKDVNGLYWAHGFDFGLYLNDGGASSGQALGDPNGYTVALTGEEKDPQNGIDLAAFSPFINP